ncbi:hypothetical protein D3C71_1380620 [compost metagenome]
MGNRRSTGQRQTGHHRKDGCERYSGEETEEEVATDSFGQVHGNHVAAANQGTADFAIDVVLRIGADDHH